MTPMSEANPMVEMPGAGKRMGGKGK